MTFAKRTNDLAFTFNHAAMFSTRCFRSFIIIQYFPKPRHRVDDGGIVDTVGYAKVAGATEAAAGHYQD